MDQKFLEWLGTLGVGGILAGGMFLWYRTDVLKRSKDCENREDRLVEVIQNNSSSHEKLAMSLQTLSASIQQAETARIQQLHTLLEQALKK